MYNILINDTLRNIAIGQSFIFSWTIDHTETIITVQTSVAPGLKKTNEFAYQVISKSSIIVYTVNRAEPST